MSWPRGTFRTADGEVSVDGEAVRIHRSPSAHLRGQFARWRRGGYEARAGAAFRVVTFLLIPPLILGRVVQLSGAAQGVGFVLALGLFALGLVPLWTRFFRATEIPLSAVSDVTLDPDERELTVTFDAGTRFFPAEGGGVQVYLSDDPSEVFETGTTERTVQLPTDDDVRDARSAFRMVDVSVDDPPGETEREYRVVTERGAAFCERCRSQVSPSDKTCPACDYALHVDRPVESDPRETSVEY